MVIGIRAFADRVLAALRPYAGAVLKEHHAEGPITVAVLEGAICFKARGDERVLRCDGLLALGEAIQHEVEALEETCAPPDHISLTARFGAC